MSTINTLRESAALLNEKPIPRARRTWGGADVLITTVAPEPPKEPSFYGDPRYVVTPLPLEVSWLFERLRDAFYAENRLDSCSKIEFFGRLASAANRCIAQGHAGNAAVLCRAVLHEAFAIHDEMEVGTFGALAVAVGSEILDDHTDDAGRNGYISVEGTVEFFKSRGLEVAEA